MAVSSAIRMRRGRSGNSEREEGQRGSRPIFYGLVCSGALHAALFLIASFGSCLTAVPPTVSAASASVVSLEIAPPAPAAAPPVLPKTALPRGGAASTWSGHSSRPSALAALAPRVEAGPRAEPAAPQPDPRLAEATIDDGLEVPATAPSDGEAPVSPVARAPDADPASIVPPATAPAAGTGPGSHGGPGGVGHGARRASLPVVSRQFALGGDLGDFKAVVCFILPGTLRIADVHRCDPAAVFYTDTFNVPERQYVEGFPGVTDRSSWFMIDYRGSFGVSQDGTYSFRLHSDDGAYLYIDDALVIENDGKHEPISRSGSVHLQAGRHQLKLLYAQTTERMALQLFVRVPGAWTEKLFRSEL
jgi:hypothetical protein